MEKEDKKELPLNKQQLLFLEYYIHWNEPDFPRYNATQSYAKAYWHDIKDNKAQENVCSSSASTLLRIPKVVKFLEDILNANGFNDFTVDTTLLEILKTWTPMEQIQVSKLYIDLTVRKEKNASKALKEWDVSASIYWIQQMSDEELQEIIK